MCTSVPLAQAGLQGGGPGHPWTEAWVHSAPTHKPHSAHLSIPTVDGSRRGTAVPLHVCLSTGNREIRERGRESQRERARDTDRQTDRQADRQTDRQADRRAGRQTESDMHDSIFWPSDVNCSALVSKIPKIKSFNINKKKGFGFQSCSILHPLQKG